MRYEQIRDVAEADDPSRNIETRDLTAKVIDNGGLMLAEDQNAPWPARYGLHKPLPFSRPTGGHGVRLLYHKQERRNVVAPFASWLNFQNIEMRGIELDPSDERVWAGLPRGWPIRLEPSGARGARLVLDPLPQARFSYTLDVQPGEPDAIDFSIEFIFHGRPDSGPSHFRGTWACYQSSLDDVRLHYPKGKTPGAWEWSALGERPDFIAGETVGYEHRQTVYFAEDQALPLAYGDVGPYRFALMFSDPAVRLFVVNAGGHLYFSPIQNPAFDFEWVLDDYPLDRPVGFKGRIIYAKFAGPEQVLERYHAWRASI